MNILRTHLIVAIVAGLFALPDSGATAQTTVFQADFEAASTDLTLFDNDTNPVFDVNVGSVSFAKGAIIDIAGDPSDGERVGDPQLYDLNDPNDLARGGTGGFLAGHTDWGDQSLAVERNSDKTENDDMSTLTGANMEWVFTDPVELDGAEIDFEFYMLRAGSGPSKHQTVTGYDSQGRELFELLLIARNTYGYIPFPDYDSIGGQTGVERQEKTVGYVDPNVDPNTGSGEALFSAAQIAVGSIPDTNPGDKGTSDLVGLFGSSPATVSQNPNPNNFFEIDDVALFSVSLSDTGWTLSVEAAPTPDNDPNGLADFTTIELPFWDPNVTDLASIEAQVATDQGGGWWDNLEVSGTVISSGLPGDFDGNGIVDGRDFLEWQRTDGSAAGLAAWESSYNSPISANANAVPEPTSVALLSLMAMTALAWRSKRLE